MVWARVATIKSRVHLDDVAHMLHIKWMFGMLNQWQLRLHAISKCFSHFFCSRVFFLFISVFFFRFVVWYARSKYKQLEAFRSKNAFNTHSLRIVKSRMCVFFLPCVSAIRWHGIFCQICALDSSYRSLDKSASIGLCCCCCWCVCFFATCTCDKVLLVSGIQANICFISIA